MQLAFQKMQGAGNQIVIVDQRTDDRRPPSPERLRYLGDAATGPGFDQLMWVGPASGPLADASYRVFNADGSEVEQCGNGVRCVVRLLSRDSPGKQHYLLDSPAGAIEAEVLADGRIAVNMGRPVFDPARIPFDTAVQADSYRLDIDGQDYDVDVLSMGNPHCVLEVADVASADVAGLGSRIEHDRRFPSRTNVGFRHIVNRSAIDLRVHERGVGETRACGTGACAAVVAGRRHGLLDAEVTVSLPGGQLVVSWAGGDDPVWLTGDAEPVSEGIIDL